MDSFLLALDVGGCSVRCSLVDTRDGVSETAARRWAAIPEPEQGFFAFSIDTDCCWRLVVELVRDVVGRSGVPADSIVGLAVAGMRFSLVLIDASGGVLYATPNHDARAAEEALLLADEMGPELCRRAGRLPLPILAAPRLRWLAQHQPRLLEQTACVLSLNDWIGWKLTGQSATDRSQAGESLLYDQTGEWARDVIDRLSLPPGIFPVVKAAGAPLGGLAADVASELGLRPGTTVAVGGADTQCGLLGAGVVELGQLGIVAGSTTPLQLVVADPCDCAGRLWVGRHVVPGRWILESNAGALGDTLEWVAGVLYPEARRPVARLLAASTSAPAGAGGVVSSLGAQVMDGTDMMSMPIGSLSLTHLDALDGCGTDGDRPWPGDDGRPWGFQEAERERRSRHTADLSRAVLEGMAFAVKVNALQLVEAAAVRSGPPEYRLAGGLAQNPHFAQLICDVLDAPLHVAPEATVTGAAICAGVAAEVFSDLDEGVRALVRPRLIEPDERTAAAYRELHTDWGRWRRLCAEADRAAAGIALRQQMDRSGRAAARVTRPLAGAARPLSILVTAELDEVSVAMLRGLGQVDYRSYRDVLRLLTGDELVEALMGYDVLITEVDIVDPDALSRCSDLRVVAACRGHAVNVDVAACTALGIPVLHAPGRNAEAAADLAVAFMLMLERRMPEATAFLRAAGAEAGDLGRMGQAHAGLRGGELWEQVVGLVGFGAVGRAVARRLRGFGAHVLVYDPHVPSEEVRALDAEPVRLDDLLEQADIVSLHAAVTDETRGLIDGDRLARMKRGAFFVNTARAALVDETALFEALSREHLAGAALDVFAHEPPGADHPLLSLPTVIATPHLGGNTFEVAAHQGRLIAADLSLLHAGCRPRHVLNPETLDGFSWSSQRPVLDAETLVRLGADAGPAVSDVHGPVAVGSAPAPATAAPDQGTSQGSPGSLTDVLRRFLASAEDDAALRRFAEGRTVRSHYVVSDLGLEFHIEFVDGRVEAGLGAPAEPADARLKARAEILDAIFTGKLSGNRAAMTGKLSFSGDVRLAMGMQRVQKDLVRLYSAAREECGGLRLEPAGEHRAPGPPAGPDAAAEDASGSPDGTRALVRSSGTCEMSAAETAVARARHTTAAGLRAAALSDRAREARAELASVAKDLFAAGLITATGGNVSVRVPETDEAWITPSQLFKGRLRPEMMVRMGLDGEALDDESLDGDGPAPSSERHLHCEIYRARPDVQSVVHAHPSYATVLGLCDLPFLPVDTEAAFLGELPRVPFQMPGSRELAVAVREALGSGPAVLLVNHGLVVAGSSLRRAADMAAVIEHVSQIVWACHAAGREPAVLPPDVVEVLRDVGEMMG